MPAAKSGNHIYVTSSPNTLASITTDIGDTTFIEKTGTSPDIYTVKGNVIRNFQIRNGGVLTIGDPEDYSVNETLGFENLANDRTRFYVDAGGELVMVGDTVIDFGIAGGFRPYYSYIYGKCSVLGNDTYKPIWQNYHRIYFYETSWTSDVYADDIWHFEKMIIGSAFAVNYYAFYLNNIITKLRAHTFKSITFDKSYGRGNAFYAVSIPYEVVGQDNLVFEDCNFEDVGHYPIFSSGGRIHVKNCTFGTTTSWKLYFIRAQQLFSFTGAKYDFGYNDNIPFGQSFSFVEGCTFENEVNKNIFIVVRGANVLIKNCEWQHDSLDSLQVEYGSQVLFWTGNTFTGGREVYDLNYAGYIQRVFALNLLVQDPDEAPIEGAIISIAQNEGKERFTFITGSDGRIHTCWGLKAAFLTHQHQYGDNKSTNVEYWSDDSNSTYHDVWIYKDGYRAQHLEMVMDADKAETVTMFPQQKGFIFQW